MKKGETFVMISGAGKGKAAVQEKGNRASHHTRIGMHFHPKNFKFHYPKAVNKYLASYGFHLNLGIKIEFFSHSVDVFSAPPKREGIYTHLQVLTLGLRLLMMMFVRNILAFYKVSPSQLLVVA